MLFHLSHEQFAILFLLFAQSEFSKDKSLSAHEQLFGVARSQLEHQHSIPSSSKSGKRDNFSSKCEDITKLDLPSPVFKSDAAREIIREMTWDCSKFRRTIPKEKRRHYTISSSKPLSLETGGTSHLEVFSSLFLLSLFLLSITLLTINGPFIYFTVLAIVSFSHFLNQHNQELLKLFSYVRYYAECTLLF